MAERCAAGLATEAPRPSRPLSHPHPSPDTAPSRLKPRSRFSPREFDRASRGASMVQGEKGDSHPSTRRSGGGDSYGPTTAEKARRECRCDCAGSIRLGFLPGHAPGHNTTRPSASRALAPSGRCSDANCPSNGACREAERCLSLPRNANGRAGSGVLSSAWEKQIPPPRDARGRDDKESSTTDGKRV